MDRVLLIIDDIQYCRHVEMTLRKMGFDVESINNEFNLNETVLTFNPDYIICKGNSSRLSAFNVGKKLKESNLKFSGKVILILPDGLNIAPDELIKLKMDLLFFEPLSTLKLSMSLFSLTGGEIEFIKDKMLKFAITDTQFRNYEQQLLRSAGVTLDSEIEIISEMRQFNPSPVTSEGTPAVAESEAPAEQFVKIPDESDHEIQEKDEMIHLRGETQGMNAPLYVQGGGDHAEETLAVVGEAQTEGESVTVTGRKVAEEVMKIQSELPLRIDSYNHLINKVDQNLKIGLKKRQTKASSNKLHKDLIAEKKTDKTSEDDLDAERIKFTRALFRK